VADSNRSFPGSGHYDFTETLAALKRVGYRGALSVECLSFADPRETAEKSLSFLRGLI
jgi:sugar phosphate isomerase/epimerase